MPSDGIGVASSVAWPPAQPYEEPPDDGKPHIWAQKGFQFHDFLDIINPLQHIPIIASIYRWITGEPIGNLPRVVGDSLYGGAIGFVTGLLGVGVKEETGKDIGEHVLAAVTGTTAETPSAPAAGAPESASTAAASADSPAAASPAPAPVGISALPPLATPAAPPQIQPDHPPIPLLPSATSPAPSAAAPSAQDPAQLFLAQAAARQRQLLQGGGAARTLAAQPVPLALMGGALPAAQPAAPPIDIPQRMLDALDKYAALQRQRNGPGGARGTRVDLSP